MEAHDTANATTLSESEELKSARQQLQDYDKMETEYLVLQSKQEEHDTLIQRYLDEIADKDKQLSAIEQKLEIVRQKLKK